MANEDDFTFCTVEPPVDGVEAQNVTDDFREIHIKDGNTNAADNSINNTDSIWKVGAFSQKQEKVGSLTFNVIDASPKKEENGQSKQATKNVPESSTQKTPARKSTPRAKVPFEKGYSPMDWLKLTTTHPDLAGLNGQSNRRLIPLSEVKQHKSGDAMWTVFKGRVYNIAPYMRFHPGGVDMLMKAVGKDCTALFNKYHAWVNAEFLIEKCLVGILDESK